MSGHVNRKQFRFVEEYLKDLNGTQAAIRAGYSPKTAEQQASRLLRNVKVIEILQAKRAEVSKRNDLTVDWVIQRLMAIADTSLWDLVDLDTGMPLDSATDLQRLALKDYFRLFESTEKRTRKTLKIKVESKVAALKYLLDFVGSKQQGGDEKESGESTNRMLDALSGFLANSKKSDVGDLKDPGSSH